MNLGDYYRYLVVEVSYLLVEKKRHCVCLDMVPASVCSCEHPGRRIRVDICTILLVVMILNITYGELGCKIPPSIG